MKDTYDLLGTFENSDVILFDTSSFNPPNEPFTRTRNLLLNERKQGLMDRSTYLDYLHKLAKLDQFYITIGVKMEALNGVNYKDYKKKVEITSKRTQETLIDPRLIKRHSKKISKLINILEENGRVLDNVTNPSEQYRNLYSRYEQLKSEKNLSAVDYHQIITGLVFSYHEKKVTIVSSDTSMYRTWLAITRREKIDPQAFSFQIFSRGVQKMVSGEN